MPPPFRSIRRLKLRREARAVPTITSASSASVAENVVLAHALTADRTVTWSLVAGGDAARFELSGSTLRWASNGTKNFESPNDANTDNVYGVTVRATATNGGTADQSFTATVTNVNEAPTITSSATFSAAENQTAVATLTATDPDSGATLTWSKSGTGADAAKFNLSSGGVLTFAVAPDYETPTDANADNAYVVGVQVSDGTNATTQTVTVTVTNVVEFTATTLDPSKKGTGVALSNGNRTATNSTGGDRTVLSVRAISGKCYFEIKPTTGSNTIIGIANATNTLDTYLGNFGTNGLNGAGYWSNSSGGGFNLNLSHDNWTTNDVIGLAVDTAAGKIAMSKNGVWQGGANPSAGTGMESYTVTGAIYAAFSLGNNVVVTANLDPADFVHPLPTGYSAV